MTQEELRQYFRALVDQAPSRSAFAKQHGFTKQWVSSMYLGELPVAGEILQILGIKRVVVETFVAVEETVPIPKGFSEVAVDERGRIVNRDKAVQRRRARETES